MKNLFTDKKSIFNPFSYIAGTQALLYGLALIILTALLGWGSNTWLDGLIDLHYGPAGPFWLHLAIGFTNWLSMVIVLTPMAMILSTSKVRAIDMAGTQALARAPMLIATATGFLSAPHKVGQWAVYTFLGEGEPVELAGHHIIIAALTILIIVLMVIWMVALMYNAYKVSANIKGMRAGVSFTAGILIAYVISKVAATFLINQVI